MINLVNGELYQFEYVPKQTNSEISETVAALGAFVGKKLIVGNYFIYFFRTVDTQTLVFTPLINTIKPYSESSSENFHTFVNGDDVQIYADVANSAFQNTETSRQTVEVMHITDTAETKSFHYNVVKGDVKEGDVVLLQNKQHRAVFGVVKAVDTKANTKLNLDAIILQTAGATQRV